MMDKLLALKKISLCLSRQLHEIRYSAARPIDFSSFCMSVGFCQSYHQFGSVCARVGECAWAAEHMQCLYMLLISRCMCGLRLIIRRKKKQKRGFIYSLLVFDRHEQEREKETWRHTVVTLQKLNYYKGFLPDGYLFSLCRNLNLSPKVFEIFFSSKCLTGFSHKPVTVI